ncbi:hypothetical protein MKD38_06210 [Cupriavidus sp. WGlv3]|uniref:hypothetical protein n=1 Tax=Cupriavidus sp. WGlv3 TaxID=2919924 RepID=UPI002090F05E|nr:hypothetical protein [Cupriavidus sp. WGlv3]MCO4861255.1 hypothetical protein [Cupriavidus sp. WGlv3]
MNKTAYIPTKNLFFLAVVLKVLFAGISVRLQDAWVLGFGLPLVVMSAYMALGYRRRDKAEVPDEKFADSCYYLGFIFTIASICACLLDIPNIGTNMSAIAVRFGAAMVSTVLGLFVRVWLVTFRKDSSDAVVDAGEAVVKASYALADQLTVSLNHFKGFDEGLFRATQSSADRVNQQIEAIAKNYAASLDGLFEQLSSKQKEQVDTALARAEQASKALENIVERVGQGAAKSVLTVQQRAVDLVGELENRLRSSQFPGDYFVKTLAAPMQDFQVAATALSTQVQSASSGIEKSTGKVTQAFKRLEQRSDEIDQAINSVVTLSKSQHEVLQATQGQMDALTVMGQQLCTMAEALAEVMRRLESSNGETRELTGAVSEFARTSETTRATLADSLHGITRQLAVHAASNDALSKQMADNVLNTRETVSALRDGASANIQAITEMKTTAATHEEVARQLQASVAKQETVAAALWEAGGQSIRVSEQLAEVTSHLQSISKGLHAPVTTAPHVGAAPTASPVGQDMRPIGMVIQSVDGREAMASKDYP